MRSVLWNTVLLAPLVSCGAPAPSPALEPALPPDGRVVHVQAEGPARLVPGSEDGEAVVKFSIVPGFHIMSDRPSKPNYIATALVFDPITSRELTPGEVRYPPPVTFALGDEPIRTFQGGGEIRVPLRAAGDAAPGDRRLKGTLHYQACTSRGCLFPRDEPFEIVVHLTKGP